MTPAVGAVRGRFSCPLIVPSGAVASAQGGSAKLAGFYSRALGYSRPASGAPGFELAREGSDARIGSSRSQILIARSCIEAAQDG